MKLKTIFAAAALVACASAHAIDAGTLLDRIRGSDNDRINAMGYVAGASEALQTAGIICMTKDVTVRRAMATIERFIAANPRSHSDYASDIVAIAMRQSWPCKRGSSDAL